ncbi:hypothetical protein L7F22_016702 [Adiantum nelumboides]|nr:hypothetical protein [Adiantum nelumboides]
MATSPTAFLSKRSVFVRKWAGFVAAIWLMIFSGCYTFPSYSSALKEVLGINQKLLNGLSIAMNVGDSGTGIVAGILGDHLPVSALLCISAAVGFVGYGVEWLVVSQSIKPLPYWMMFIAAITSGSAVCWMNVAVFSASVRNFKGNRGPVAGLFKAYMGLSAAVFVTFCDTLFSNSAFAYLLMLVILPSTFCLVSAVLFQPVPSAEAEEEVQAEQTSLRVFNGIACGLAVYIAALALLPTTNVEESYVYKVVAIILLIAIVGAPALVPLVLFFKVKDSKDLEINNQSQGTPRSDDTPQVDDDKRITDSSQCHSILHEDTGSDKKGLLEPLLDSMDANGHMTSISSEDIYLQSQHNRLPSWSLWRVEELGEDTPTLLLFKAWHYYIFYFSLFCGCGSAVSFSYNLAQVGQAFGFSDANLFASLFSLGNFFGRITSGNASEYYIRAMGMPRPAWMGLTKLPMILLFLWLSTGSRMSLYVGSPVLGLCLGALVTLSIPIVSEFYGTKHFGTNFSLTNTYFLAGLYAFSSLAGYLYDKQSIAGGGSSSSTCEGAECYGMTFLIMASCLTIALACDAILTLISRPLYKNLRASSITLASKSNNSHKLVQGA